MATSNVGRLASGDGGNVIAALLVGVAAGGRALPRAGGRAISAAGGALASAVDTFEGGGVLAGATGTLAGAGGGGAFAGDRGTLAGDGGTFCEASTVGGTPTVAGRPPAGAHVTATNMAIRSTSGRDKVDERTVTCSVATPSHLGCPG
jgi:hypothetical protein